MELIIISRPIMKSLLIHEVNYTSKATGSDTGWGEVSPPPILVKRVRIEPKAYTSTNANGTVITSNTTMFWDSVHSSKVEFVLDGKISWRDNEYLIKQIDDYFDDNRLHHKELRLL